MAETSVLLDREFVNSREQLEAKARELRAQGYGKRKNASHGLSEAVEHVLWSSGILLLFCVIMAFYSAEYFGNRNNSY